MKKPENLVYRFSGYALSRIHNKLLAVQRKMQ